MLNKTLFLEIDRPNYVPIYTVQYDYNSRFYEITILNNSQPLDLTGIRVIVAGKKPDGKEVFNSCKVLDAKKGLIQLELTEQMNGVNGASEYALELFSADGMLSSQPFKLIVTRSTISKSVESSKELGALKDALNEVQDIDNRFAQTNAQLSKIKTFDIFPSDEVLDELPIDATFEVKGFYEIGDMPKCLYKKTWPGGNSVNKTSYCIKPITDNPSEVFLPSLGIRTGSEYAVNNSEILSKTYLDFGSTLVLPSGDYYFDRPIDLASNQLSLTGKMISFTTDLNTKGLTWLYFMNLNDGESAINIVTGSISNVIIKGNASQYDYVIDRTKTYVDKSNIEQENFTVKCYGIKGGCTTSLNNVHVANFYYGCYLDTGNIYITNFYARKCHIGLSIGNDTKCKGIYGWDLHTMLQIRGSSSSAVQVRCDSCYHLIHLIGYVSGNILTDLDADYCLGSVIKIGEYDTLGSVENLVINGVVGRHCCLNVYDTSSDIPPTTLDVVSDTDVSDWAFIGVERKNTLNGALITMAHSLSSNPLDSDSNYRTPEILLAAGAETAVIASFNTNFKNNYTYELNDVVGFNRQTMLDSVINFSEAANNTMITFNTPTGNYYYHKSNPSTIITTKTIQEELT